MAPMPAPYSAIEGAPRDRACAAGVDDTRLEGCVDETAGEPVHLGDEVWLVDTQMGGYDGITAGYLVRGERPCLVETGAARSAGRVVEALASLGVGPDDLGTIVVTHIHLDHAGGVGDLAAAFPRAQVVVHEAGARHLVDPSRLMASAERVFGPVLGELFGLLRPTDAHRIRALSDGDEVDLGGGRTLSSFDSPGHARHHVGLLDSLTGDLYTGDAAGVWTPETGDLRPATPPPEFDLDAALASLERMRDRRPTRLLFSHFGPVTDVGQTLDRSVEELRLWVELVREARHDGLDLDHAVARVRERTAERYAVRSLPEVEHKLEVLSSTEADVAGIWRWLDRVPTSNTGSDRA
jgi:glyoxylase-like metal-dependent hydrolase (beta-lactamase superfamily II)